MLTKKMLFIEYNAVTHFKLVRDVHRKQLNIILY